MTTKLTKESIETSIRENRTVTEYPDTQAEYDALVDVLRVECADDCDGSETSGEGHSERTRAPASCEPGNEADDAPEYPEAADEV